MQATKNLWCLWNIWNVGAIILITGLTEPRQGTPGRMPDSSYSDQTQLSLQRKSNRDPGFICWTSVIRVGQLCRFLCRVASAMVCPSNLGECSLVRLLFFQNLHWVFGYGLQCLGLEELSSNILVSETCDFFYTISFCRFSNFKNLSSPELALFQGVFPKSFISNSRARSLCQTSYNWEISKLLLSVKI